MTVHELSIAVPEKKKGLLKRRKGNFVSLPNQRYVVDGSLGEGGFKRACQLLCGEDFGGRYLDAGTVGAMLPKKIIQQFIDQFYRQPVYQKRARRMVEPLDAEQNYYLLATECIEI